MFGSPSPAPGTRGALATRALRSAGLVDKDRDTKMRDASDKPGGRKGSSRIRAHRPKPIDSYKDQAGPSGSTRAALLAARIGGSGTSGPDDAGSLSIRGASRTSLTAARTRRVVGTLRSAIPVATSSTRSTVETWREFVNSRWNPEAKFLNLEDMANDEIVKKNRLAAPGAPGSTPKEAAVIFKHAGQLQPPVETVSLARNNLTTGQQINTLGHYLPNLANLSLQDNKFRMYRDLDFISGRRGKLKNLRELIMHGNPLREDELRQGKLEAYKSEICQRFITLELLDGDPIVKISFDAPSLAGPSDTPAVQLPISTKFPAEMGPSFIAGIDGSFISNFLIRFFPLFDSNRLALLPVYDPAATFSFSANTDIPTRARLQNLHHSKELPNQTKLEWGVWLNGGNGGSRNLGRMQRNLDKTVSSLHVGDEGIMKTLAELPGTKHDIEGPPEKFSVDSWMVPQGASNLLFLCLHGQFIEEPVKGIRSFDRTFALAPSAEGSRAKLNGWDVVILSDQWNVRGYSLPDAWRPGFIAVQAGETPPGTLPPDQQVALAAIPEPQRDLVLQISQRTGLNVPVSVQCLTGNGWDLEKAVTNFEQVKGTLAREAFL